MYCNNTLPSQPLGVVLEAAGDPVLLPPQRSIDVGSDDAAVALFLNLNPSLVHVQLVGGLSFSANARFDVVEP